MVSTAATVERRELEGANRTAQDPNGARPERRKTRTTQDPNDNSAGPNGRNDVWQFALLVSGPCVVRVMRCLAVGALWQFAPSGSSRRSAVRAVRAVRLP